jgi:ferric-dicitrate binding protein FerR (iron transport regulator)
LRKNPRERLQATGDARVVLGEVAAGTPAGEQTTSAARPSSRRLVWEIAGVALLVVATAALAWKIRPEARREADAVSFTIALRPV